MSRAPKWYHMAARLRLNPKLPGKGQALVQGQGPLVGLGLFIITLPFAQMNGVLYVRCALMSSRIILQERRLFKEKDTCQAHSRTTNDRPNDSHADPSLTQRHDRCG